MDEAFVFDNYVTGRAFVGRHSDCMALGNLVANHENVCIYGAPKSGKTSLVHQTLINIRTSGRAITVPMCDLSGVRTAGEFAINLVCAVMKQFCDGPSDCAGFIEQYLSGTGFGFDESMYEDFGKIAVLHGRASAAEVTSALMLPYRVASERSCDICVVFDEFQNVLEIDEYESILKEMEKISAGSAGSGVSSVFCGSAVNAMRNIFFEMWLFYHCRWSVSRM